MRRSFEIDQIADALAQAQAAMKNPSKDGTVDITLKSGGKKAFKYATLDALIDVARPALSANGIGYVQAPEANEKGDLVVTTMLLHSSGQWVETETPIIIGQSFTVQEFGSAITYAKRYGFGAITGLTAEQDDDASLNQGQLVDRRQGAQGGRTGASAPPPAPPPPPPPQAGHKPPQPPPIGDRSAAGQAGGQAEGQTEKGFLLTWPPDVFTGKVVTRHYQANGTGALGFLDDLIRALGTNRSMLAIPENQKTVQSIRLWAADDPKRVPWLDKIAEAEELAATPIGGGE